MRPWLSLTPSFRRAAAMLILALAAAGGAFARQADPGHGAPPPVAPETRKLPLTFRVSFSSDVTKGSFTGRVYVMLSTGDREPRFGPAWFGTQPFFARDVKDWNPDTPLGFDDRALSFPYPPSQLPPGEYMIQAVMRINPDSPEIGTGAGTAYSVAAKKKLNGAESGTVVCRIRDVAQPRPFKETDRIKLVELKSDLLSAFHGRDIVMRAAVVLPDGYERDPERRYPALYWIGGFGSDHREAFGMVRAWDNTGLADNVVHVVLDPSCYGGHHVFADSANNGPRGQALVQELIPFLEKTYKLVAAPTARFVSGHSSGGWSSLWLQTAYPDFFGGVWSIAPDPVDFRDFQRIDLYKSGVSVFTDENGARRPIARMGDRILGYYDDFSKMENVVGEGGQLRSFEWVFSPAGSDGLPLRLYNRKTGVVDAEVAQAWKKYDIRMILEDNWATLGPKLKGKLHVFVGDMDTFYLDGAVRLLKQSLEKLGSDAVVEIVPNRDHSSVADPGLRKRIERELLEVFNRNHPQFAKPLKEDPHAGERAN